MVNEGPTPPPLAWWGEARHGHLPSRGRKDYNKRASPRQAALAPPRLNPGRKAPRGAEGAVWWLLAVCGSVLVIVRACVCVCVCVCCAGLCGLLWESPTHTSLGALEGARKVYVIRRTPGNIPGRHPVDCRAVLGDEAQVNVDA